MFHGTHLGKGGTNVAAPIITPSPQEQEQLSFRPEMHQVPIKINVPNVTTKDFAVRALPMVGIGAILAGSVYFPPSLAGGIVIIGAEVALGAIAVAAWFPRHSDKK
jgi:hypothetical protein